MNMNRRVQVHKSHSVEYPELWLDVYVHGHSWEEKLFAEMFVQARCRKAFDPESADLVVFTGGPDVDPELYGEKQLTCTNVSPIRDKTDAELYKLCFEQGIPMFGVCRGLQFLHVMNGGKLYQNLDNHTHEHAVWDRKNQVYMPRVSSVHHQSCIFDASLGAEFLMSASVSKKRETEDEIQTGSSSTDVEALWYPDTLCFGVQGHPEYKGYEQFTAWCLKGLEEYIVLNPNLEWVGSNRRMKPADIEARNRKWDDRLPKNASRLLTTIQA